MLHLSVAHCREPPLSGCETSPDDNPRAPRDFWSKMVDESRRMLYVDRMGEAKVQQIEFVTSKQLATELHVTEWTLNEWRKAKVGPPYRRLVGRNIYYRHEVNEWLEQTKWG